MVVIQKIRNPRGRMIENLTGKVFGITLGRIKAGLSVPDILSKTHLTGKDYDKRERYEKMFNG